MDTLSEILDVATVQTGHGNSSIFCHIYAKEGQVEQVGNQERSTDL